MAASEWPNAYLTVGSELLPEYREFERGTTAAINGFVQPVIDRYLRRLAGELARQGYQHELLVMQGNGGTMSVDSQVGVGSTFHFTVPRAPAPPALRATSAETTVS